MKSSPSRRAAALVAILCGVAVPAAALDVLEGLAPLDFRVPGLAGSEARALAEPAPLDPADWIAAANPVARSSGGPTLTDVGVATVAAEVGIEDKTLRDALIAPAPVDLRVLATRAFAMPSRTPSMRAARSICPAFSTTWARSISARGSRWRTSSKAVSSISLLTTSRI